MNVSMVIDVENTHSKTPMVYLEKDLINAESIVIEHGENRTLIDIVSDRTTGLPCIQIKLMKLNVRCEWTKMKSTYLHKEESLAIIDALHYLDLFDDKALKGEEKYLVHEFKLGEGRAIEAKAIRSIFPDRGKVCLELTFTSTGPIGDNKAIANHNVRKKTHRVLLYRDEANILYNLIRRLFLGDKKH